MVAPPVPEPLAVPTTPDRPTKHPAPCPGWRNLPIATLIAHSLRLCPGGLAPLQRSAPKPFQSPVQPLAVSPASLWGTPLAVSFVPFLAFHASASFFSFLLHFQHPHAGDLFLDDAVLFGPIPRDSPTDRSTSQRIPPSSSDVCALDERPNRKASHRSTPDPMPALS